MVSVTYDLVSGLASMRQIYLDEANPWTHYGDTTVYNCYAGWSGTGTRYITLLNLKLPEAPPNASDITGAILYLWVNIINTTSGTVQIACCRLNHAFRIGENISAGPTHLGWGANWYTYDGTHQWRGTTGTPVSSPGGGPSFDYWADDGDIGEIYSYLDITTNGLKGFNLGDAIESGDLNWGGNMFMAMVHTTTTDPGTAENVLFINEHYSSGDYEPYITLTYDYTDTNLTPEKEDNFLTVEPSEHNPYHMKFSWPSVKDFELRNDSSGAYLLVASKTPIQDYTTGALISRSTANSYTTTTKESGTTTSYLLNNLVDTAATFETNGIAVGDYVHNTTDDTWAQVTGVFSETRLTLDSDIMASGESYTVEWGDGTTYYFRMMICDGSNYMSGSSLGQMADLTVVGTPQWSNEVVMEKPEISTFVESGADYSWNVWEEHTVNVTATAPSLSGVENTAYQYDWYGNETETGWKTLQTPANSDSVDYAYTKYGAGTVTPKVRIKNNLGYWSSQQSLGSAITLTAVDAVAVCKASPMVVDSGDVLRLRADDSDDRNGDGSITKYEFQVQRTSDSYYWNGSTGWQVGSYWKDVTTTPYVDVPAAAINHTSAETYTCKSRVTGLSTSAVTSSGVAVTGRTETAVTITSTLSGDTEITAHNSNGSVLTTDATPIDGTPSTAVRIEEGLGMLKGSLEGVCHRASNFHADMAQIWTWKDNKTLLRYYYESVDDTPGSYYIDFKIDDVEERKRDIYWYEWQLKISILNKV